MAETQYYLGRLSFASDAHLHDAWTARSTEEGHLLEIGYGVEISKRSVHFDIAASAPHDTWFATIAALWAMAEHAQNGVCRGKLGKPTHETANIEAVCTKGARTLDERKVKLGQLVDAGDPTSLMAFGEIDAGELTFADDFCRTVLAACAHRGHIAALSAVLSPKVPAGIRRDALLAASAAGQLECIDMLIEAGAAKDPNALLRAASADVVDRLVIGGFDPNAKGTIRFGGDLKAPKKSSPIAGILDRMRWCREAAEGMRLADAVLRLEERLPRSALKTVPIFEAVCASGSAKLVEAALAAGADVNPKPGPRMLPLGSAILAKDAQCVAILVRAGAKAEARDLALAKEEFPDVVHLLLGVI